MNGGLNRALRGRCAARRSTNAGGKAKVVGGALLSSAITVGWLSPAGIANAVCPSVNGISVGPGCSATSGQPRSTTPRQSAASQPSSASPIVYPNANYIGDSAGSNVDANTAGTVGNPVPSNPVAMASSLVGTDAYGPYGCEDFVDAAFGRTINTGIPHDAALSFYQSLADRGLAHHETPIPAGALVFSNGPDGGHVDISRGDGTYISGGVQGLSAGYGDGHNVQILPAPNLGSYTLSGWAYSPW